jgi:spore germination protein YaaH
VGLVRAKNLDGVNVDFEGAGSTDQTGLDRLMARVSTIVRGADVHWQITMDTYASSAGDSKGFYDISGLAPSVDAFFVMAYQMGGPSGSVNEQFSGSNFSAEESMQEYTQVVPSSKVILGLPFYGYDWPTTGPGASAAATGPASPVPDSQISSSPAYWNQSTGTAWTAYKIGKQWHQTWYDDPQALAQKAQVATSFNARGVGIWTLGMEGNDPAMLAALVGNAPVVKAYALPPSGPAPNVSRAPTTSTTRGKGTTTTSGPTTTTDPQSSTTTTPSSTTTTQPTTSTTMPPTTTTTEPQTTTTTSSPTTTTSTTG